jgi:adenosylcobinamide-GDP ribazoletransferase
MNDQPTSNQDQSTQGYSLTRLTGLIWLSELIIAAKYLTRIRFPTIHKADKPLIARSMAWFPLIGAVIGAFGAVIETTTGLAGMPSTITASLAVAGMLWLTRALHEEELATLANQYGDAGDKSRRVGWLKEDRSIRYGTFAVIFSIILKVFAIASINNSEVVFITLIASGAWSHAVMSVAAAWLKPLPDDPVSDHFGQPPGLRVLLAVGLGAALVFAALGVGAGIAMGTGIIAAIVVILLGSRLIGGYNGPLLGGLQQVVELVVICTIVATQ